MLWGRGVAFGGDWFQAFVNSELIVRQIDVSMPRKCPVNHFHVKWPHNCINRWSYALIFTWVMKRYRPGAESAVMMSQWHHCDVIWHQGLNTCSVLSLFKDDLMIVFSLWGRKVLIRSLLDWKVIKVCL